MSAPPFMPLYIGDYLADTVHLNGHESGAYLHLLMCMWRAGGSLPNDPAKLARFAKLTPQQWARVEGPVMEFFTLSDGAISHSRLTREIQKYEVALTKRTERASLGGKAKALKNINTPSASSTQQAGHKRANQNSEPELEDRPTDKSVGGRKPRGSRRCPPEWNPEPDLIVDLIAEGYAPAFIERELSKMKDYTFKQPRAGSDWSGTFRNWVRKDPPQTKGNVIDVNESRQARAMRERRENYQRAFSAPRLVAESF